MQEKLQRVTLNY